MKKGFTLLELLVVIAVAAILVSIASASYSSAQKKARDSRRTGDMHAVQNAAEQYYADNNAVYPTTGTTAIFGSYLPGGYPNDPKPTPYVFTHTSPEGYCSCAYLEGTNGNATSMSCGGMPTSSTHYYCVKSLQ